MPKTTVKPAAKKMLANGQVVDNKPTKSVKKEVATKAVPEKNKKLTKVDTGAKTIAKKAVAKVEKPEPKKATAKRTKDTTYTPHKDSMRYFVLEALKQGIASVTRVKQRAAKLAAKAGIKQYATEESFAAFDVAFFAKMLEEKGYNVERDGEKLAVAA